MDEFHFLRPWWLAALPVALWLVWMCLGGRDARGGWLKVVDAALQPFVLARPEALAERRLPLIVAAAIAVVATVAAAGPTWERLPVPAFRSDEALVVAFDLSRSMDAQDLEPSRLARAKLKLLSLLDRRGSGQTALVVFSAHAFTVTPLTTDIRTIAALVNALQSDIMPSRGSFVEAGLDKAGALLEQTAMTEGDILLITDADVSALAIDAAQDLRRAGFEVSVLAVGTEDGAPIPERSGGFVTDRTGQVVIPRLDVGSLRRLAEVGGGRFAQITADDRDLDRLFPRGPAALGDVAIDRGEQEEHEADVWQDQGIWLTLLLLPLVAMGFRRGWVYAGLLVVLFPGTRADAFQWQDLWQRADQQGIEALTAGEPDRAAELFADPKWRAAAQYRAGDYPGSAQSLAGLADVTDYYNKGNALARSGELEAAIEAYDRALELEPTHADALYNRDLVSQLLEQQEQQQQNNAANGQQNQNQASSSADPSDQSQAQDSQSNNSEGETLADSEQPEQSESGDEQEDADGDTDEPSADAEQQQPEPQQLAATSPEDVEEWADEQAADQWLRRIPQDPGGLLRRKFLYQYQRLGVDQEGNYVWPGDEAKPW